MKLLKGSVVMAEAGRDKGSYFAVVDADEKYCLIADGKSRKLANPKRKNIKHIRITDSMIDLNDITDKRLRNTLKQFGEAE
ncbi:KOW domain-containing RNA-binding protein [Ruminococcus sp.]|uniref:KOW domain-containing RNA-binding protein n=1 Tax=Ruminococcus sp. TaxID=41978 RepID=UPI001B68136C|nr:KOW domain-containing RNA-binding protein [Ruminococcus sp.]MBP5431277.1 KOW domain-containing RNA-binding protein [Ruminococcus sp.]